MKLRMRMVALAVAILVSGCAGNQTAVDPMHLRILDGSAVLYHQGKSRTVRDEAPVEAGDRVVLSKGSSATLRLAGRRVFELVEAEVRIVSFKALDLEGGQLLAEAGDGSTVNTQFFEVSGARAVFRVDRGLSTRVANYRGNLARVKAAGSDLNVPALRQAVVAGIEVPRAASPIRMSAADRWDIRFLAEAIELDKNLANFARGLEAQLGPAEGRAFFERAVPDVDLSFLDPYMAVRRSDVLIGLLIALNSKNESTTAERFQSIFRLWEGGATWGLLAFEHKVAEESLFSGLLRAVERVGIVIVGAPTPAVGTRRQERSPSPGASPGGGSGGGGGGGGQSPSPSPSPTRGPNPVPSPVRSAAPAPVASIIDDLSGTSSGGFVIPLFPLRVPAK